VRRLRLIIAASAVLAVGLGLAFVNVTLTNPTFSWPERLIPLGILATIVVGAWYSLKPPALKANSIEISIASRLSPQRMSRSELAFIFRGEVLRRGQYKTFWDKSYIFATSDGEVRMSCSASELEDDGVGQFAQRLKVPIRGDFSVKVKYQVGRTSI
jgi:hypothetical protein